MLYELAKILLFRLSPERAHGLTMWLLRIAAALPFTASIWRKTFGSSSEKLERTVFGIRFPNPVGLAAGFDKDGRYIHAMQQLGFGFIEVGTVTPVAQPGNPKPRLFRLPADQALINRMGFNNLGTQALANRLKYRPKNLIIGGNIGKNKNTPNENATDDYLSSFETLFPFVDYFAVNVSSPNTPGLRALQEKEPLLHLLQALQSANRVKPNPKPILLKIAPDLTHEQLDDIIDVVRLTQLDGVIATNTTMSRDNLTTDAGHVESIGAGGLSGAPMRASSTAVIHYLHKKTQGRLPIIGVGGIGTPDDAIEKLKAGASLVQIYTGMVYYGPHLARDINKMILEEGW